MARNFVLSSNDRIDWTGGSPLFSVNTASLFCWFRRSADGVAAFLFDQQAAFNKRILILIGDGANTTTVGQFTVSWRTPTAEAKFTLGTRWDDGAWHRLLVVRRNSSPYVEAYVDGVSDGSSTTDPTTDPTSVAGQNWANNFQGGYASGFGGDLARCGFILGTELTPKQADSFLYSGRSSIALDQWLDLGIGSTEPDWSGKGLNGTPNGTTVVSHPPTAPPFGLRGGWQGTSVRNPLITSVTPSSFADGTTGIVIAGSNL